MSQPLTFALAKGRLLDETLPLLAALVLSRAIALRGVES